MASSSSSVASNKQRHSSSILNGRLVPNFPLLPSKVRPPVSVATPVKRTTTTLVRAPLVLKVSPATSPKVKRKTPPASPRSLPAYLSPNKNKFLHHSAEFPTSPSSVSSRPLVPASRPKGVVVDLWVTSECESGHEGLIYDMQCNSNGTKLATVSEDKTVRVFDVDPKTDTTCCVATLRGHNGPVTKVAWADSAMGNILASASSDGTVKIWKDDCNRRWSMWMEFTYGSNCESGSPAAPDAKTSVFSVSWAPWTFGLAFACGYANGDICVYLHVDDKKWTSHTFKAHTISVTAVTWGPAVTPSFDDLVVSDNSPNDTHRLASCGEADLFVKIWRNNGVSWIEEAKLDGHMSFVRDIAWSPHAKKMRIAACGADMRVVIWTFIKDKWEITFSVRLDEDPCRISWNVGGNQLLVAQTDNQVFISESGNGKEEWTLKNIRGGE